MKTVAITGGIGSGKSTLREWFNQQGIPTLDSDQLARELVEPGQLGLQKIITSFGNEVLLTNGTLNRQALRQRILTHPTEKTLLESILHPLIREKTQQWLTDCKATEPPLVVIEIPLLVETGKPDYIDVIVVADCAPSTQIARVQSRNQMRFEEISLIMQQQVSREDRLKLADIIIDTDCPLSDICQQLAQNFLL